MSKYIIGIIVVTVMIFVSSTAFGDGRCGMLFTQEKFLPMFSELNPQAKYQATKLSPDIIGYFYVEGMVDATVIHTNNIGCVWLQEIPIIVINKYLSQ